MKKYSFIYFLEKTCKVLPAVVFAEMNYSRRKQSNGYPLGTTVKYSCKPNLNQNIPIRRVCKEDGWDNAEPVCCMFDLNVLRFVDRNRVNSCY